ncbi:MAG: ABC-F family ATP-binding cassette domain-containing protein [bacterium]
MIQIQNISKSFGGKVLFNNCSLLLQDREKIAIVGANGTGKSTFFKIIMGEIKQDKGEIIIPKNTKIGYLPQEIVISTNETVLNEVLSFSPELVKLEKEKEILEHKIAKTSENDKNLKNLLEEYGTLQESLEHLSGYDTESKAKKILQGLGFNQNDFSRYTSNFSGGWLMRIALSKLLLLSPNILLLDEPTNHLDLYSVIWLQEYLLSYPGTIIFTSHDRDFVNKVTTKILELENSQITSFSGNFDFYQQQKKQRLDSLISAKKNQDRKIEQLEKFIEKFKAKNTKATQARSKMKMLEKMEKIELPQSTQQIHFSLQQPEHKGGKESIILENITKKYEENTVYKNLNLTLYRGEKVVLVGFNGSGKSTLLKILAGVLNFDSGQKKTGHKIKIAYYAQHQLEMLKAENTIWDEILSVSCEYDQNYLRKILGSFLFKQDDIYKKVKVLSGGEKSRLTLAKILLNPPNLLLMDEPVNHLDIQSRDVLKNALKLYTGTLCFISHDIDFIRGVANKVIEVKNGQLFHYPGDVDYYFYKKKLNETKVVESLNITEKTPKIQKKKEIDFNKKKEAEQRNKKHQFEKEIKEKFEKVEKELKKSEKELEEINNLLMDPNTYKTHPDFASLNKKQKEITILIKKLNDDFLKCLEKMEEIDKEIL